MTSTERARHHRRRRTHAITAAVIAASTVACTTQPAKPATPAQLSNDDVRQLYAAQASRRPAVKPRPRRHVVIRRRGDPTPAQLRNLRWCESGRDNSWHVWSHSDGRGLYQFLRGTWASVGGHGDPAAASYAEQTYRAVLLYRREGWRPWLASSSCTGLR